MWEHPKPSGYDDARMYRMYPVVDVLLLHALRVHWNPASRCILALAPFAIQCPLCRRGRGRRFLCLFTLTSTCPGSVTGDAVLLHLWSTHCESTSPLLINNCRSNSSSSNWKKTYT